ncbi:hypothetical protein [Selenomonas sp. AB3002]|uniref:hypothetical protein n=1 Tax=Selenomonas sp. AB3002 TaxID=1392502 RepID=UPI00163B5329
MRFFKFILTCLFISLCTLITNPQHSAYAHPLVRIDYGDIIHGQHSWWAVDKGSLKHGGRTSDKKDWTWVDIEVSYGNYYEEIEFRKYHFVSTQNGWEYTWKGWTGKHAPISSGREELVSNDRLANDILYIALH